MSKAEILEAIVKLNPEERQELRLRLAELDEDEWLDDGLLTEAEKTIIEERFRDLEKNPHTSIPWEAAKTRLLAFFER